MQLLKIAYRNSWRNKRRTLITAGAIFIALFVALLIRSLQVGTYASMIEESIGRVSGYIQIQNPNYFYDPSIDNALELSDTLQQRIMQTAGVKAIMPRIETGGLAAYQKTSRPVMVTAYTGILAHTRLLSGTLLTEKDSGILLSDKLATYLGVTVGDTLTLLGQGYHGTSAAGLFPVRGLIKSPSLQLANKLIYMQLPTAQHWLGMGKQVSYIAINLHEQKELSAVQQQLSNALNPADYVVKNWSELFPSLHQAITSDEQSGLFIIGLLYLIIFLGVVGTVMMMVNERKREFSMLYALGMRKRLIKQTLLIEMSIIGLLGIFTALLIGLPIIAYYTLHPIVLTGSTAQAYMEMGFEPIMPAGGFDTYILHQLSIVFLMVLLACYIPIRQIRKIQGTHKA